jgi:hypothetical protein
VSKLSWLWGWRRYVPPKRWYPFSRLEDVTTQMIAIWTMNAVKISTLLWMCNRLTYLFKFGGN